MIYVNIDSPIRLNQGFPYFNFLGGVSVKKNTLEYKLGWKTKKLDSLEDMLVRNYDWLSHNAIAGTLEILAHLKLYRESEMSEKKHCGKIVV